MPDEIYVQKDSGWIRNGNVKTYLRVREKFGQFDNIGEAHFAKCCKCVTGTGTGSSQRSMQCGGSRLRL